MAEPDGVMDGPRWPSDFQTGWVTWTDADVTGEPIAGSRTLSMTVARAISVATGIAVHNKDVIVPLVDGRPDPAHPLVEVNSLGVPCVEWPLSRDPDVTPYPITMRARESWSSYAQFFEVLASHTLDAPLVLTADLQTLFVDPKVTRVEVWLVPTFVEGSAGVAPAIAQGAVVGDWVLFQDNGRVVEITADDV